MNIVLVNNTCSDVFSIKGLKDGLVKFAKGEAELPDEISDIFEVWTVNSADKKSIHVCVGWK